MGLSAPPAGAGELRVDGLVAGYRGAPPVLLDVSLAVAPGEIVVVLGRNGAGKTSLLRTISGVLRCRAGRVTLGLRELGRMPAHRIAAAGVAHVPEGRRVIAGMSVADNLRLGAHTLRRRAEIDRQLEEVLGAFPVLRRWQGRTAGSLSGGEQQMLAIARGLMGRPDVVLLDEPLTGLAPIFRRDVLAVVRRMRDMGKAVLLAEQNVAETLPVADRALVIDQGSITLSGPAGDLASDPALRERYLGVPVGAGAPDV